MTELALTDVVVRYRHRTAVGGVSGTLRPGVTLLLGPNGAGKSSLIRVLAGMQSPTSGSIRLTDNQKKELSPREGGRWQEVVGHLPQEPEFAGGISVYDTVALAAWLKNVDRSRLDAAVQSWLERVGLSDRRKDRVRTLSGGMRRRLGLATAAVHEPALLLLDEPTAGLDPEQRLVILRLIAGLAAQRVVLMPSHVLDDARRIGDRIMLMHDGKLDFHGTAAELTHSAEGNLDDLERAYLEHVGSAGAPRS